MMEKVHITKDNQHILNKLMMKKDLQIELYFLIKIVIEILKVMILVPKKVECYSLGKINKFIIFKIINLSNNKILIYKVNW